MVEPRSSRARRWARFSGVIALAAALAACAGKSTVRGDDDGNLNPGGTGGSIIGGSTGATGGDGGAGTLTGGTSPGTGGSIGVGGSVGTGGGPDFGILQLQRGGVERVDLLLTVDNSIGMAEKQQLLSESLPVLVDRLTAPACVDDDGAVVEAGDADCPPGSTRQFRPVTDLHVGVVTSSLGSHGSVQCTDASKNDFAELLGARRSGLASWADHGFLAWDPGAGHTPPGEANAGVFVDALRQHVNNAGETGCGYESSLEAWYRFLVDPEPVKDVSHDEVYSVRGEINGTVLAQRETFLRSDSALMIVMLSDENDCSILDENDSQGWLVGNTGTSQSPFRMPRASSACAADPNDACCRPCTQPVAAGCPDDAADAECQKGATLDTTTEDHPNLRCFEQMQRFGVDLLYPTSRYVQALTEPRLIDRHGNVIQNPLFTPRNGSSARDRSAVMLVGIVGVPWLDLSDPAEAGASSLRLFTAEELARPDAALMGHSRWDLMLGSPGNYPPMDPFMLEQIEPRTEGAQHPLLSGPDYAVASAGAGVRNLVNGHEQNVVAGDDLQYACIFPLPEPVACDPPEAMGNDVACDCNQSEYDYDRPTCSYPDGTNAEGIQEYAKAYPGVRQLEVLRGIGSQAVVGSICPKNTVPNGSPEDDPFYGYNPIVHAMAERFERIANPGCLPLPLPVDDGGLIACRLVEAFPTDGCACDRSSQRPLEDEPVADGVLSLMRANGQCDGESGVPCESLCLCEIDQLRGSHRPACTTGAELEGGFCYVDTGPLVERCPADQARIIRIGGEPQAGATLSLVCEG
jgi:hypothetical protein